MDLCLESVPPKKGSEGFPIDTQNAGDGCVGHPLLQQLRDDLLLDRGNGACPHGRPDAADEQKEPNPMLINGPDSTPEFTHLSAGRIRH